MIPRKKYVFICGSAVMDFIKKDFPRAKEENALPPLWATPVYQDDELCGPDECGMMPEEDYQFLLLVRDYKEKHYVRRRT